MAENAIDIAAPILNPEPVPEVPAPAEEKQITMSQSQLDSLIKSRQAASLKKAAAAEAEVTRLKAITVGSSEDASIVEKLRAEIALETQRASAAEARAVAQEKNVLLGQLGASINAIDATSVGKLLSDSIVNRDGKWTVIDEATGAEKLNPDGSPTTPAQHYESWASSHLWAIKAQVKTGAGSTPSSGHIPLTDRYAPEKLWGPNAVKDAGRILNEWSLRDKRGYDQARKIAVAKGLVN